MYHGPTGLTAIATRIAIILIVIGTTKPEVPYIQHDFFDTVAVNISSWIRSFRKRHRNRSILGSEKQVIVALDETATLADIVDLVEVFTGETVVKVVG